LDLNNNSAVVETRRTCLDIRPKHYPLSRPDASQCMGSVHSLPKKVSGCSKLFCTALTAISRRYCTRSIRSLLVVRKAIVRRHLEFVGLQVRSDHRSV
jgi:hypothetical protein